MPPFSTKKFSKCNYSRALASTCRAFIPYDSRHHFGMILPSKEENRKFKLFPFINVVEKYGGVPICQKLFCLDSLLSFVVYSRAQGYKKIFMLNSAEHGIFPTHKC